MADERRAIDRYRGDAGPRRILDALREQKLVAGDSEMAAALAQVGTLKEYEAGDVLIQEGDATDDMFLIFAGQASVTVRGSEVAQRGPGEHVGEQAIVDPLQKRSATVTAIESMVVLRISEAGVDEVGSRFPGLWKNIAKELSRRLVYRNRLVRRSNDQIQVFIICSREALWIAEEVRAKLNSNEILCTLWTDGVFRASYYSIESLEGALIDKDFAIAVAAADDFVESRGEGQVAPRDNVIFELGLFMGRLGRHRTFLLEPRDEDVKLPSDLAGLTTIPYKNGPKERLPALLGAPCHEIRRRIEELKAIS